jgi:hypothetical protein
VGAVVAAVALASMGAASAAPVPSDQISVKIARQESGPFADVVVMNLVQDQAKNAYLKVKSISGQKEDANLQRDPPAGITVKYFDAAGVNITDAVQSAEGYDFKAKPDKAKRFRVKVKQTIADAEGCFVIPVHDDEAGQADGVIALNFAIEDCG